MSKLNNININILKHLLAIAVYLSHLTYLTGNLTYKIFDVFAKSEVAVHFFFLISAYLTTKSLINNNDIIKFYLQRFFRIYPAYIFTILICIIIGLITIQGKIEPKLVAYSICKYFFYNSIFANFAAPNFYGTSFLSNINIINGSLWTLKIELIFYLTLPLILYISRKTDYKVILCILYSIGCLWLYYFSYIYGDIVISRQFPGQLPFFVVGIYCAINKDFKNSYIISGLVIGIIINLFNDNNIIKIIYEPIFYLIVFILILKVKGLDKALSIKNDLSYGIYLVHYPIIQLLINMGYFKKTPLFDLILCSFVIFLVAYFMSTYIEKRCSINILN